MSHLAGIFPPTLATFRLDPSTGAVTPIGAPISSNGAGNFSAVLHPSGRFLLHYNTSIASLQVYTIDPTTFAPTLLPTATPIAPPLIDFSGKYLYTANSSANTVSSYRFDTTTGAVTPINTLPTGLSPTLASPFGFQPQ